MAFPNNASEALTMMYLNMRNDLNTKKPEELAQIFNDTYKKISNELTKLTSENNESESETDTWLEKENF